MIPNPIHKVLSTLSIHRVQYLLMGGQACVFYGAAEFSRDCDIVIHCEDDNLQRLREALHDLEASVIAVPPFEADYLRRGHAVHFRCGVEDARGIRIVVMSKLRGVGPFEELWSRRTTIEGEGFDEPIELMSLPDLIAAKRTQRDKDWPMLRRLVEAHHAQHQAEPTEDRVRFWLLTARTPDLLLRLAAENETLARTLSKERPLLTNAIAGSAPRVRRALADEQEAVRVADEQYWAPLKKELEELRRAKRD